jgi:integrase
VSDDTRTIDGEAITVETVLPDTPVPPRQDWMCTARLRDGSGTLCRKPRLRGQKVCGSHGGFAPQNMAAAENRLRRAADPVVAELVDVAMQPTGWCKECGRVADALKVRAMIAVLDRAFDAPAAIETAGGSRPPDYLSALTDDELTTLLEIVERAEARARRNELRQLEQIGEGQ